MPEAHLALTRQQLLHLLKGKTIQLKHEHLSGGTKILVSEKTYKKLEKAHRSSKGSRIKFDPEEHEANLQLHGGSFKSFMRKVKHGFQEIGPELKKATTYVMDHGGQQALSGLAGLAGDALGNPELGAMADAGMTALRGVTGVGRKRGRPRKSHEGGSWVGTLRSGWNKSFSAPIKSGFNSQIAHPLTTGTGMFDSLKKMALAKAHAGEIANLALEHAKNIAKDHIPESYHGVLDKAHEMALGKVHDVVNSLPSEGAGMFSDMAKKAKEMAIAKAKEHSAEIANMALEHAKNIAKDHIPESYHGVLDQAHEMALGKVNDMVNSMPKTEGTGRHHRGSHKGGAYSMGFIRPAVMTGIPGNFPRRIAQYRPPSGGSFMNT